MQCERCVYACMLNTAVSEAVAPWYVCSCVMLCCAPCRPVSVRGKKCKVLHNFLLLRRLYSQLASSALSLLYLTGVNINIRILWVDCCPSVLFLLTAILTFLNAHCCHCTLTASSICSSHQGCCPVGSMCGKQHHDKQIPV